jgi:DNA-binding Lrp family transcriptional regulator
MVKSVLEIAELTGTSKSTVRRAIQELEIEADGIVKNTYKYSDQSIVKIVQHINPDFDFTGSGLELHQTAPGSAPSRITPHQSTPNTAPDHAEPLQSEPNCTKTNQGAPLDQEIVNLLKAELDAKNKQIEELQRLLDQSQQLQLITQRRVMELEGNTNGQGIEKVKKENVWKRLIDFFK